MSTKRTRRQRSGDLSRPARHARAALGFACVAAVAAVVAACGGDEPEPGAAGSGAASQDVVATLTVSGCCAKETNNGVGVAKWAELIEQHTDGRVKAEPHFGDLGADLEVAQGVQQGTIDLGFVSTAVTTNLDPRFGVLDLPFIFNDYDHAYKVLDGDIGNQLLQGLDSHGIVGFSFTDLGWRNFVNNKGPVKSSADLKGLKMRSLENPAAIATWKSFGATPVPLPASEMYLGLRQGTIDGLDMPVAYQLSAKLFEVSKFYSVSQHTLTPIVLIGNKAKLQTLPQDVQDQIAAAAKEAAEWHRDYDRQLESDGITELQETMTVNELTPAERDAFKAQVADVYDVASETVPRETIDAVRGAAE